MILKNHIGIFKNAVDTDYCNRVIDFFENKKDFQREVENGKRKDISLVPELHGSFKELDAVLNDTLHNCYIEYKSNYKTELPDEYTNKNYKIQKSSAGGGFCSWHAEWAPLVPNRFLAWMLYLNTVSRGGKTEFHDSLKVKPVQGTLVLWPAYFTHLHRASKDLQEDKYIMTGWLQWGLQTK